jgi:periplasmic nitrate reductase NapE
MFRSQHHEFMQTPSTPDKNPDDVNTTTVQAERLERRMFIFLTVFLAPIMAVASVGLYGLIIWLYQMFAGPPTG